MIKQARTILDTRHCITLMQSFLKETTYRQAEQASKDIEHLGLLSFSFMQKGFVWLAFDGEKPVGMLIAVKEPNMWSPKDIQMREMIWYVLPEYRTRSIGGKLFLTYCNRAEELLASGQISGYFTTRMTTTDTIDLEKRGFRLTEQTYLKE